jgi:FkbM family methyltransferase
MRLWHRLVWLFSHPAYKRHRLRTLWRCFKWECLKLRGKEVRVTLPWGVSMWCRPGKRYSSDGLIYVFNEYEDDAFFVQKFIKPGMTALDIGANVGFFTLMMARLAGDSGRVHAFEPSRTTLEKLRRNIEENAFQNITILEVALSDRVEERALHHDEDPSQNRFGQVVSPAGEEKVACRPLDAELGPGATFDFVKIDVEGAELLVFRGAEKLLAANPHAPILCEFNDANARSLGFSIAELARFFLDRDYRLFHYDAKTSTLHLIDHPEIFRGNAIAVRRGHTVSI